MSALVAAPGERNGKAAEPASRPALRPLATPRPRMARLPFLIVLIGVFGVGMAGLLLLNTTLQNQAFEARRLTRQASELTYVQDDLQAQLQSVSAPASLAQKAYAQGLRPNDHPAFLVLPDGTVRGKAQVTKGDEMRSVVPGTDAQLTQDRAAREAAGKRAAAAAVVVRAAAAVVGKAAATIPPAPAPSTSPSASPTSVPTPTR